MIRVTIDIIPQGDATRTETIYSMVIVNDCTEPVGTPTANYDVTLRKPNGAVAIDAKVTGHLQADGAVVLVSKAMAAVVEAMP